MTLHVVEMTDRHGGQGMCTDPDGRSRYDSANDARDMRRLGRTQLVKRRFRFFSIVGYMVVLAATWESALISLVFSLSNGGTAGAIWLTLIACFGMFATCLSMAEVPNLD